ncbi:MAG: ABC transporter permease [Dongiaceae bacterium]
MNARQLEYGALRAAGAISLFGILAFMLLPIAIVVPVSFTPERYLSLPGLEWSLRHYEAMVTAEPWIQSVGDSILIALISGAIATLLALSFGLGLWYSRTRYTKWLIGFVLLPMIVPPIVSAVTVYFLEAKLGIIDSYIGLVLAHTIMIVPYATVTILIALLHVDRRLEMAGRNAGASTWQITWKIILPNIRFGLVSAFFLAVLLSWEEVVVTLFISGIDIITLPKRIWDGLRLSVDPIIAAVSVVLIGLTLASILVRGIIRAARSTAHARAQ